MESNNSPEEQLSQLFSYKAEWLKERLFELFTQPTYFPALTTSRPCMLVGGRGTGKTTALRGLSYEGQLALSENDNKKIKQWQYYGIYYRVNTNRVTIFTGQELSETQWIRTFGHYFNLIICDKIARFLIWYEFHTETKLLLGENGYKKIALSLHLSETLDLADLSSKIENALIVFEAYVNNIEDEKTPRLSAQGAPIDVFMQCLSELAEFKGKHFFLLVDEYENFEDYQQQVVNTLIKHSASLYSYKIGIRELGWRRRTTLNPNEQLISPADYDRIDIVERLKGEQFKKFARQVCETRLAKLDLPNEEVNRDIRLLLPGLTEDDEAELLGITKIAEEIKKEFCSNPSINIELLEAFSPLQLYFIKCWSDGGHGTPHEILESYKTSSPKWNERYENYKHSLLFMLRRGKRGIRKFYCGWDTFTQISNGNIRYFLELVDQSLALHLRDENKLSQAISYRTQTDAAQLIGKKNLSELEGLSEDGGRLTKLLLGLGRIFGIMASDSIGHTPEVNQFYIEKVLNGDESEPAAVRINSDVDRLIQSSVRNLALVRSPGNKLLSESDTNEYDYMIHPIFSAFFVFSYRRKRKMLLKSNQILGLVNDHQSAIREILLQNKRAAEEDTGSLPDQLSLFQNYFRDKQ